MDTKRSKMKIAFVLDRYRNGGVSVVLEVLMQLLLKTNAYEITLFVRDIELEGMRKVPEGVILRPWEDYWTVTDAIRNGGLLSALENLTNRMYSVLSIRSHAKKVVYKTRCRGNCPDKFDCVIAYHMIPNDVAVMALEKIPADRRILWLHFRKNIAEREKSFYTKLYAKADAIVGVSGETAMRFLDNLPACAEKTIAIHNLYNIPGILRRAEETPEGMDTASGVVKLVTVARLAREKGFDRVPEVAKRLKAGGYNFQWYIVGDGNMREEIEQDIQEKGVVDCVHLLGHRSNPYPYIQNCDIYVQSSYMEGFCTSTMEAKILGKAVVTTNVPGMREQFVSGENGLIVESSVQGLFDGIRRLLDDPVLRERIENKLRREPITNDEVLRQTMAVIEGRPLES